ncbi:RluA family pseudouridine synthase [Candidatus Bealeia paramacronuclearis]|uniref:Pseudouridine synthase n=1 Tax=Candidatus Bealeia paramacronuclearis TaxID=1921001 RepID=A0ABZ2C341_9PROT|nr:RluA family pseudouridine synthase [Candidatus Bealeia paramacronuclearis]
MTTRTILVSEQEAGLRLDKFLSLACPDLSRTRIQNLIEEGHVLVEGRAVQSHAQKTKAGWTFVITIPEAIDAIPEPQDIPLEIIYEDDDLLVLNKPAGLVVHPAPGNHDNTLVNALLAHCGTSLSGIGGVKRPGIVHRLDKDTSGLMIVAKNDLAHHHLSHQLSTRTLSRTYQAFLWGIPKNQTGTIRTQLGRHPKDRKKMAVLPEGGKEAITHYQVLETYPPTASLVECRLETGRTHQIRVHMTHLGHPLLGDPVYGRPPKGVPEFLKNHLKEVPWTGGRQALHAAQIKFIHPRTGDLLSFSCPLPEDMRILKSVLDFK